MLKKIIRRLRRVAALPESNVSPARVWSEAIAIPCIALLLAYLFRHDDPFAIQSGFHWLWVAPLLVALRYGVLTGLIADSVILLAWPLLGTAPSFPYTYFLGGFVLTMIAGEYGSLWRIRIRRLTELNLYLDQRIEQLSRRHLLLRLSHERLEQSLISRPTTLRDALAQLAELLKHSRHDQRLPAAQAFLDFLAQTCQFESAAIFEYEQGALKADPIAHTGAMPSYALNDPLITYALKRRLLCHVQNEALEERSALILALPLISSDGYIYGILAVESMDFFALTDDNLHMLAALSIYYVEQIAVQELAAPILAIMPSCPAEFAYESFKLQQVQRQTGISSAIIVLVFKPTPQQREIFDLVKKQQRSRDMVWPIEQGEKLILATLMPLSSIASIDGYLARIEDLLHVRLGMDLQRAGIEHHHVDLARPGGILLLQDVLRRERD